MINIEMEVIVVTSEKNLEVVVTRKAALDAQKMSFEAVAKFMADVAKINILLKSAIKKNQWTNFSVCNYEYDRKTSNITAYDRWYYTGYPGNDNCELDNGVIGYYLQPDTKYTTETHDMVYDFTLGSITDGHIDRTNVSQ